MVVLIGLFVWIKSYHQEEFSGVFLLGVNRGCKGCEEVVETEEQTRELMPAIRQILNVCSLPADTRLEYAQPGQQATFVPFFFVLRGH